MTNGGYLFGVFSTQRDIGEVIYAQLAYRNVRIKVRWMTIVIFHLTISYKIIFSTDLIYVSDSKHNKYILFLKIIKSININNVIFLYI